MFALRPRLLSCLGLLLALSEFPGQAQSPYSAPLARFMKNLDGTSVTLQVDPENQRVVETLRDASGAVKWKIIRELDADSQPVRGIKLNAQDEVISRHNYLSLRGRIEEEEVLNPKGILLAKMVYHYDKKGRMTQIDHYNAVGKLVSTSKASGREAEIYRR